MTHEFCIWSASVQKEEHCQWGDNQGPWQFSTILWVLVPDQRHKVLYAFLRALQLSGNGRLNSEGQVEVMMALLIKQRD